MSDHHHHDDGQRVRTIYAVAIGIVILIGAALFWVTQSKSAKAHAGRVRAAGAHAGHAHGPGDGHGHGKVQPRARMVRPGMRRAAGQGGAAKAGQSGSAARVRFAQRMHMRVRRHDKARMVLATGKERDILEMRFPMGAKGDQLDRFRKATQLFTELKGHGFRQMRIRSGRSVVFTKNL